MSGQIDTPPAPAPVAAPTGTDVTTTTPTTDATTTTTAASAPGGFVDQVTQMAQTAQAVRTAAATVGVDSTAVLTMSEQTTQFVIKAFALCICLIMAAIAGVLCYRVAVDGNAPLTEQITQQLASLFPWLAFALVTAIIGKPAAQALLAKFLP